MNDAEKEIFFTGFTLDFETGGLDCRTGACTQIAIHAVRLDTMETMGRYVRYIKPYCRRDLGGAKKKVLRTKREVESGSGELMGYEVEALKYSDISMDMLDRLGEDVVMVAREVIDFVKGYCVSKSRNYKPILMGQNVLFDIGFLQQLMAYGGMTADFDKLFSGYRDFYGNFQPYYLDTILLGRLCFAHDESVTSYKLELLAERLGIELDDAHDADADVTATTGIVAVCANRLRNGGDGSAGEIVVGKSDKTRKHFKI